MEDETNPKNYSPTIKAIRFAVAVSLWDIIATEQHRCLPLIKISKNRTGDGIESNVNIQNSGLVQLKLNPCCNKMERDGIILYLF